MIRQRGYLPDRSATGSTERPPARRVRRFNSASPDLMLASRASGPSGAPAADLTAGDNDGHWDAFARNLRTGVTTLVSRADGINGANTPSDAYADSVSGDGRLVVFDTAATDPFAEELYVRNLVTGTTTLVSRGTSAFDPSISGNGRIVAFGAADASGTRHVYLRDMADRSGSVQIVDRRSGPDGVLAQPVNFALTSSVAPDGHAILFQTAGFAPAPGGPQNVSLRELRTQTTTLVSGLRVMRDPWPDSVWPNLSASVGSISADNRLVAFSTTATDLDRDLGPGVYVRRLRPRHRSWSRALSA